MTSLYAFTRPQPHCSPNDRPSTPFSRSLNQSVRTSLPPRALKLSCARGLFSHASSVFTREVCKTVGRFLGTPFLFLREASYLICNPQGLCAAPRPLPCPCISFLLKMGPLDPGFFRAVPRGIVSRKTGGFYHVQFVLVYLKDYSSPFSELPFPL